MDHQYYRSNMYVMKIYIK